MNMFISPHWPEVDCQSTIRNLIDNDYINIRAVDNIILVDLKPFSWQRISNFLNEFFNDANDFVYIGLLFVLFGILIFLLRVITAKTTGSFIRPHSVTPSAPPMPSPTPMLSNIYAQTYEVHNEDKKSKNGIKEKAPYTGDLCRACQFKAKSNAGLNTHIKAMLSRKNSSKTIHSQHYR